MRVRKVVVACVWGWMTNALARPGVGKDVLEDPDVGDRIVDIAEKLGVKTDGAGNCLEHLPGPAEDQTQAFFAVVNGVDDFIDSRSPSSSGDTTVFEPETPCSFCFSPPGLLSLSSGVQDTMAALKTALFTQLPVVLLSLLGSLSWNEAIVQAQPASCPDFTLFAMVSFTTCFSTSMCNDLISVRNYQSPQGSPSSGPLGLPLMRPAPQCRTFNSSAVEVYICSKYLPEMVT